MPLKKIAKIISFTLALLTGTLYGSKAHLLSYADITVTAVCPYSQTLFKANNTDNQHDKSYCDAKKISHSETSNIIFRTSENLTATLAFKQNHSIIANNMHKKGMHESRQLEIYGKTNVCEGDRILYSSNSSIHFSHNWVISPETSEDKYTLVPEGLYINWDLPGEYILKLTLSEPGTNFSSYAELPVIVHKKPEAAIYSDTVVCFRKNGPLMFTPAFSPTNTIVWPGNNNTLPPFEISAEGIYNFIEVAPNECRDTGSIRVIENCIPEVFIAEAFTPNGDGINDFLQIKGDFTSIRFFVYTLNGEQIFISMSANEYWDGTYNGEALPNATYLWKAYFTNEQGNEFSDEGFVLLMH
ncbi:MAG: gliding motility-associated C-terminal domain-containing protein [Bacteroidales bacterium]|nr:gliding motility-associated C-terminal domain-containing protein [Bacteroidales bacterium]